jgi:hypothetical protein
MPALRPILLAALLLPLAACSPSDFLGDGDGDNDADDAFEAYLSEGENLIDAAQGLTVTDPAALPTGTVTFNGVMVLGAEDEAGAAGELELVAAFDDDDISGSLSNVVDTEGVRYSGSLGIDGAIDPAADTDLEPTFGGVMAGTLVGGGETFTVTGTLSGDFAGTDAEFAAGGAAARACAGTDCTDYEGDFIAQR